MKHLFLLCLLACGLQHSAVCQTLEDLDKRNGFRDLTFSQSIAGIKGLIPLSKAITNERVYKRTTDVLKIANVPLKSITYTFYRSVLWAVHVTYNTPEAREKLLQSTQIAYGLGVDTTLVASPTGTIWIGKDVSMVLGDESPGIGELLIQSRLVDELKKQDDEVAYKKRTGSL